MSNNTCACSWWRDANGNCTNPACVHHAALARPETPKEKPLGDHYRRGGIEAWDVIEAWDLGFNMGNIIKYAARCGVKTPDRTLDLEKIKTYIEREIQEEKRRERVEEPGSQTGRDG